MVFHHRGAPADEGWRIVLADGSWKPIPHEMVLLLEAERALADDLADVLNHILFDDGGEMPDVERVLARYRQARGR
jgi:hypothetical protein